MKRVSYGDIGHRYTLSPYVEPVVNVRPDEALTLVIHDAMSGQIKSEKDVRDRSTVPFSNPVVGPVYVEGAEKGDTISVLIEDIRPLEGLGVTGFVDFFDRYFTGTSIMKLSSGSIPRTYRICKIVDNHVLLMDGLAIPYNPMIGLIAVAPHPELHSISTLASPGPHGGNMDIPDVRPGSRVLLPVFHKGALLYVGDAHAVQGDGEITGMAVEMSAEVTVKIGLIKGKKIQWPRLETDREMAVIVSSSDGGYLNGAIGEAFIELSSWIAEDYNLSELDAFLLCGQTGKIRIGNLWTVSAKIEKSLLAHLSRRTGSKTS